jgi:hypothetical protein
MDLWKTYYQSATPEAQTKICCFLMWSWRAQVPPGRVLERSTTSQGSRVWHGLDNKATRPVVQTYLTRGVVRTERSARTISEAVVDTLWLQVMGVPPPQATDIVVDEATEELAAHPEAADGQEDTDDGQEDANDFDVATDVAVDEATAELAVHPGAVAHAPTDDGQEDVNHIDVVTNGPPSPPCNTKQTYTLVTPPSQPADGDKKLVRAVSPLAMPSFVFDSRQLKAPSPHTLPRPNCIFPASNSASAGSNRNPQRIGRRRRRPGPVHARP